MGGFPCFTETE